MKHMIVIEQSEAGRMRLICRAVLLRLRPTSEVLKLIEEAIEFHIEDLIEAGELAPPPSSASVTIEVNAAEQTAPADRLFHCWRSSGVGRVQR